MKLPFLSSLTGNHAKATRRKKERRKEKRKEGRWEEKREEEKKRRRGKGREKRKAKKTSPAIISHCTKEIAEIQDHKIKGKSSSPKAVEIMQGCI